MLSTEPGLQMLSIAAAPVGGTRVRKLSGTWGWATIPAVCLDSGLLAQEKQVSATTVWCHSYHSMTSFIFLILLKTVVCSLNFGCAGSWLVGGLSLVAVIGATLQWWSTGFSSQRLLLCSTGSQVRRLSSCSSQAQEHRPSSCGTLAQSPHGTWDLPASRMEPVSPALTVEFSATEPPGKPQHYLIPYCNVWGRK